MQQPPTTTRNFDAPAGDLLDPGLRPGEPLLTPTERAEADLVARRLVSELRPLVEMLPEGDRGASAMSRLLRLDRATCQRLVASVGRGEPGVETLVQLPGILGLRQFIAAVAQRNSSGTGSERIEAARAAVDRFAELIDELGGSQRKLRARLAAERAGSQAGLISAHGGSDDPGVRQALFRAAAAATGRWCDVLVQMVMIHPVAGSPGMTETVHTRGMIGHRARPDAVPLEVGQRMQVIGEEASARHEHGMSAEPLPGRLVEEFCSRPLPRIVTKTSAGQVIHVVDVAVAGSEEHAADIVLMQTRQVLDRHPATLDPPIGEVWRLVNMPSRHMVFDVFLHREIACRCIPSLELHLWTPEPVGHVRARWSTRFTGGPKLEMMGPGLERAATAGYPRYVELAAHVMREVGWNPAEMIGYRCELPYPLWRGGYCMSFDFTGNELGQPHG